MYEWRKLTEQQQKQIFSRRRENQRPWHSPPHFEADGAHGFHLSAACYEHAPLIGTSDARMVEFEEQLMGLLSSGGCTLYAWCVLPNHWHALVRAADVKETVLKIGQLHGKTSFQWNGEDNARGRKCWYRCADRRIRSDRHFYVARNYIHHNPVKHGYVEMWEDWLFSSARSFIEEIGHDMVLKEWKEYPPLDMGRGWDD